MRKYPASCLSLQLGLAYLISELLLTLTHRSRNRTGTKQDRSEPDRRCREDRRRSRFSRCLVLHVRGRDRDDLLLKKDPDWARPGTEELAAVERANATIDAVYAQLRNKLREERKRAWI